MFEQVSPLFTRISFFDLNILLLLGLALFGGTIGGRVFQKLKIPQVVGYIIIGIVVGQTGFNIIDKEIIETMQPFNYFALGLIGFAIGGELKREVFKRYGKQFAIILLSEGLIAFIVVFLLVGFLGTLFFGQGTYYWALGLLLGAISSATAPAATTDVLWEYKTRGPLTTMVLGIVAMDDGLALMLFAIASSIAAKLLGQSTEGFIPALVHPLYEIGGAIVVGTLAGLSLSKMIRKYTERERVLAFSLGAVLFVLGFSLAIKVDMLLAAMALGTVVVNCVPRMSKEVFKLVSSFASPLYVLFFVLIGAKLNMHNMTLPVIAIASIYLIGRTIGKMVGAMLGGRFSGAPSTVQKYLPFCLFSQAGVAIGLSIVAYHAFPGDIGLSIVIIITASTFVVQLLGPTSVKYAVEKAQEVGLNITEEDILRKARVEDVMDKNYPLMYKNIPLTDILDIFSQHECLYYPVVETGERLAGVITVESIRRSFQYHDLGHIFVAHDIMDPPPPDIPSHIPISEAREMMDKCNLDYLPVVTEEKRVVGVLERGMVNRYVSTKMIELEQKVASLG
ncbi:MAG: cation:proton antiporter [Candidatus Omnitrophica bacterium]|nr:cation:proton antiporter [Candidatus Omnitrophota bacterium]